MMKSNIKVFTTLSMAAAVGRSTPNGWGLYKTAFNATRKYPAAVRGHRFVKQISKATAAFVQYPNTHQETLGMLAVAVSDIISESNDNKRALLEPVLDEITGLIDPNEDLDKTYEYYERWVEECGKHL